MNRPTQKVWDLLTSLKLTIVCLSALMVLVVACTLAQVRLGTLGAVNLYMRSWFYWIPLGGFSIPIFPGGAAVGLDSISDTLPTGFTYSTGSTTGATTADPSISGQGLTWTGPFSVPAGGSLSLHFGVSVPNVGGRFLNNASANATDPSISVAPTGPTAEVDVTSDVTCTTGPCTSSSTSPTTVAIVKVPGASDGDVLTVSLGGFTLNCANYKEPPTDVLNFTFTGTAAKHVYYTIRANLVDRPIDQYQACYGSTNPFTTRNGTPAVFNSSEGIYVGLLPMCKPGVGNANPCLKSRFQDTKGNITLLVYAPSGDPHMH